MSTEKRPDRELTPEQVYVCRQQGTEAPFSGKLLYHKGDGVYTCVCCGTRLFDSQAKFDSGSGWPSFFASLAPGTLKEVTDVSHGMRRTEVRCGQCDAHLGHVFPDGPDPTGLRYCINSVALEFAPRDASEA